MNLRLNAVAIRIDPDRVANGSGVKAGGERRQEERSEFEGGHEWEERCLDPASVQAVTLCGSCSSFGQFSLR